QTANIEEQKAKKTENAEKLRKAARDGDIETVSALLQAGVDPNIIGDFGNALLWVASEGHKEIVEILLKDGIEADNGSTALMVAARHGHKEIVKILLKAGVDPNIKDPIGMTALSGAALNGRKEIVEILKEAGAKE
ncbi:MAG: ankyrin repeat domain-containing protein, partial [Elusimicrobiota bacterium]|nr:ankyrin repeat domain-containing protein [Elusimicrobiota bacterium]